MKKTDIYIYNRTELETNRVEVSENEKNNIKYKTEKTIGSLYNPNSNISVGQISYINELVISPINSLNTSIGTIITNNGSLVFNFNYVLKKTLIKTGFSDIFVSLCNFVLYLHNNKTCSSIFDFFFLNNIHKNYIGLVH